MQAGERQVAPTLDGIRRDHVARYEWAAQTLRPGSTVVDFACGIGYGTFVLAAAGHIAVGYDIDAEAIAYGDTHYAHPLARRLTADANDPHQIMIADAAVCFETIEHIADPRPLLKALHASAGKLLASVPNELAFPWNNHAFHFRHYTPGQFEALLAECGWRITGWHGQQDDTAEVEAGLTTGRTLIVEAVRVVPGLKAMIEPQPQPEKPPAPDHVVILGLGPSVTTFLEITKRIGGRHKFCDEVWAINGLGDVFACDRIFHMDDVRIQEIRAAAAPDSNIAALLPWLKKARVPVITSRAHPDYPALVEFPLQEVLNDTCGFAYFNSTAAYAIVYAIWLGVKRITVFGNDFTYENAHHAEKGRACVEFWLGFAQARGIKIVAPVSSSLLDACNPQEDRIYGYDTLDVTLQKTADGVIVGKTPKATLPTAEEIEHRYDHNRHPNQLIDPDQPKKPRTPA